MTKTISASEVLDRLRGKIGYGFSQSDLASACGVSPTYVTQILAGRKPPSEKILRAIGVKKVVVTSFVVADDSRGD